MRGLTQHPDPPPPEAPTTTTPPHTSLCAILSSLAEKTRLCHFPFPPLNVCSGPAGPDLTDWQLMGWACPQEGLCIRKRSCWLTVLHSAIPHARS